MWIASEIGFVSIVADMQQPGCLLVRARAREDLERFRQRLELPGVEIRETPRADYRFKLSAPKAEVAVLVAELLLDVEYNNFKQHTLATFGPRREDVYHQAWEAFLRIQTEGV